MEKRYAFDWDPRKASLNRRKHGISFEEARTVFGDPAILTVPDDGHSDAEERWYSIGYASSGRIVVVVHLWEELAPGLVRIRLISARDATRSEREQYWSGR